jgi:hypothetical protein
VVWTDVWSQNCTAESSVEHVSTFLAFKPHHTGHRVLFCANLKTCGRYFEIADAR